MDCSILANFPVLGVSGVLFLYLYFISNNNSCKQTNSVDSDEMLRHLICLHCLPARSQKWDTRHKRVNTDSSKAVLLLWFLTVTCSCCPYLYFGSAIMLVTYFSKF